MAGFRLLSGLLLFTVSLCAHPMGNFSISHYSRLDFEAKGFQLTYILDFAEIPTFELFQHWGIDRGDVSAVEQKATAEAPAWMKNVLISVDGRPVVPELKTVRAKVSDGAGGMSVMRIEMKARVATSPGRLSFDDGNYSTRTGWKEIVIAKSAGVNLQNPSQSDRDLSHALTVYPADLTVTPPQDLHASVRWSAIVHAVETPPAVAALPVALKPSTPTFAERQPTAPGTVNRGDFLSQMLRAKHFDSTTILIGLLVAFGLGALHALSPGHGKTIVAAYLVGSRGTLKHALFLGLMVTFTHTVSVFALGLGVLFFQKYVVPERIIPVLGAISGLSIVAIGTSLLYRRLMLLLVGSDVAVHTHDHGDGVIHSHTHDGSTHSHAMPSGGITLGSLIALGASGGLVPCPSALILLLSAIALGHAGLGIALLTGFSTGLALVLMGIGAVVLYAKQLLPQARSASQTVTVRLLPVFSSVVVIILGLLMTLTAVNVIRPVRLLG